MAAAAVKGRRWHRSARQRLTLFLDCQAVQMPTRQVDRVRKSRQQVTCQHGFFMSAAGVEFFNQRELASYSRLAFANVSRRLGQSRFSFGHASV